MLLQKTKEQKRVIKEIKEYEVYFASKTQEVFFLLCLALCSLLDVAV